MSRRLVPVLAVLAVGATACAGPEPRVQCPQDGPAAVLQGEELPVGQLGQGRHGLEVVKCTRPQLDVTEEAGDGKSLPGGAVVANREAPADRIDVGRGRSGPDGAL